MPPRAPNKTPKKIFATIGYTHLDPSGVPVRTLLADRRPTAPLEATALAHVDGTRTIAEIGSKLGLSEVEAASLVSRLVDIGCVTLASEGAAHLIDDSDAQGRPTLAAGDASISANDTRDRATVPGPARSS